jgi:hypothetical protein
MLKMKTVQIGTGKVRIIQCETLKELQKVFSEREIVETFNLGHKIGRANALRYEKKARSQTLRK